MDKYYYLVAQLPLLAYGKEIEISIEYFLIEAKKWMSAKDYSILMHADINEFAVRKRENHVLAKYKIFESCLREDIASWRDAKKRDIDFKPSNFPVSVVKEGNPLEVELKLMELRWNYLKELEIDHDFDLGFLIIYYLKMQIIQRYLTFNKEKGLIKFQKLYEVNI